MTGLTTATAATREWAGWGTMAKFAANRTLGWLTGIPDSTIAIFYFNKARDVLSQQNLYYPVTITHRRVLFEVTMINGQDFTIS